MNVNSARKVFLAAIALYLLWVLALATMAVVSATRPAPSKIDTATDLTAPTRNFRPPID